MNLLTRKIFHLKMHTCTHSASSSVSMVAHFNGNELEHYFNAAFHLHMTIWAKRKKQERKEKQITYSQRPIITSCTHECMKYGNEMRNTKEVCMMTALLFHAQCSHSHIHKMMHTYSGPPSHHRTISKLHLTFWSVLYM